MEKEFVPYELALKLKELGFDEPCLFLYNSTDDDPKPLLASPPEAMDWNTLYIKETNKHLMSAPTFSQAFRWFREKYLDILVKDYGLIPHFTIIQNMFLDSDKIWTYEEAELACLIKLIEIVKNLK